MASQQVGFSFQGDVIGGASLIHTATGRLLKALSDGGIDFYAVSAAVQLGKHIPIQPSQEVAVTRLLAAKTGSRAGFLAKALQIGWGHSDIAIELSKTRAGVSAMLTIGALATGSTDFVAAQTLSELMILHGCEPDSLPTIDVLKAMISYLAPFMHDSEFNKVFEHITSSLKRACALASKNVLNGLLAAGEPPEWARAMKHLISTANLGETAYLCVEQRGAWLATYAVHVQCMAVKIVVDKVIMWEAAGTRGVAVIQLGSYIESSERMVMIKSKLGQGSLEIVAAPRTPAGFEPMQVTYPLGEALDKELSLDPRIDNTLKASIRKGILRLVDYSMQKVTVQEMGKSFVSEPRNINGRFPNKEEALLLVCRSMGIIPGNKGEAQSEAQSDSWNTLQLWDGLGCKSWLTYHSNRGIGSLRLLDTSILCTLLQVCGCQQPGGSSSRTCFRLCGYVKGIIAGFAAAVLSLAQCVFDPSGLRLYANAVNGTIRSDLTRKLLNFTFEITDQIQTKAEEWLLHLSFLLHGEPIAVTTSNLLAVSVGSSSIYYRAILDEDCFDELGRVIAICPGRISVANTMRNYVVDSFYGFSSKLGAGRIAGTSNVYPVGLNIKPHYAQGAAKVSIACSLQETVILLSCSIYSESLLPSVFDKGSGALNLCFQIGRFLQQPVPQPCHHTHDRPYTVTGNSKVQVATLGAAPANIYNGLVLYATAGCPIEQMIQGCMLSDSHNSTKRVYGCFQGEACLECALNYLDTLEEKRDPRNSYRYIIMS